MVRAEAVAARLRWPGRLAAGQVGDARLISRKGGSPRGTLRFGSGEEAMVDGLPADVSEGGLVHAAITREAMSETGRLKRAHARLTNAPRRPAPSLAEELAQNGATVEIVHRFPSGEWEALFAEAWAGESGFDGGSLTFSVTPAMTLVDIDGALTAPALARAAIEPLARALARFDLAGSIGVDFPSLARKTDRKAVDQALSLALGEWPHEQTAMNGFGFVQIVSRLERASILHRLHMDRSGAAARFVLRRAEQVGDPGRTLLLTVHPAVRAAIRPEWETCLSRRTGRALRWRLDPALALDAGFAQALQS